MDEKTHVNVEAWEMKLVENISRKFVKQADQGDLESALCAHLFKLKKKKHSAIKDWKAYLALSLLRRAQRCIRIWSRWRDKHISLERCMAENKEGSGIRLEDLLSANDVSSGEFQEDILRVYQELSLEQKALWDLLLEEGGDTAKVARRLGRPRTTVDYHIQKLRKLLKSKEIDRQP